jgi:predicted dienelactone hydrolase
MRAINSLLAIILCWTADYAYAADSVRVVGQKTTVLELQDRDRELHLDIRYPEGDGVFPLVVFHHGALCTAAGYGDLANYWASHGYVVVMPFQS